MLLLETYHQQLQTLVVADYHYNYDCGVIICDECLVKCYIILVYICDEWLMK